MIQERRTALEIIIKREEEIFLNYQSLKTFSIKNTSYCVECENCTEDETMIKDFSTEKYLVTALFNENTMPVDSFYYQKM